MATPDSEIHGFPLATTAAVGDEVPFYDVSETVANQTTKRITRRDFFGYTSGILETINYGIGEQAGYVSAYYLAATNVNIYMARGDAASGLFGATSARFRIGSINAYGTGINTNNTLRFEIHATTGVITSLPTYGKDLAGGTLRTMVVDDTGQFGYNSSTRRAKTEIIELPPGSTDFLNDLQVKQCERPGHPGQKEIVLIAEEVDKIQGIPHGLVTHETYIVDSELLLPITNDDFEDPLEVKKVKERGKPEKKTVWKIKSRYTSLTKEEAAEGYDIGDVKEKEQIEIEVKRVPETVEENRLIIPMLAEMQKMKKELNEALDRIKVLEEK